MAISYDDALPLLRTFMEHNPNGGGLHIVLADGNVENDSVQWCIDNVDLFEEKVDVGTLIMGQVLLGLSVDDRRRFYEEEI